MLQLAHVPRCARRLLPNVDFKATKTETSIFKGDGSRGAAGRTHARRTATSALPPKTDGKTDFSHTARGGGSETTVTTRRAAATAATDNCRTTFRAAAACNPQIADGSGGARAWPPRMLCEVKDEVLSRYSNFDGKKWLNKWGICKNLISQLKSELLTLNDS